MTNLGTIGENEERDPFHYGQSLLEKISRYEGQEISTHTFSHYYCLEDGQTAEQFEADLKASLKVNAASWSSCKVDCISEKPTQ